MPKTQIKNIGDLKKLQQWMKTSITTPYALQPKKLKNQTADYLTGNSRMNAKERFEIYVNDFWPRILDSLADDFPKLKKMLGNKKFEEWIEKYIQKYPSTSFTLFYLGKNLPRFMNEKYRGRNKKNILETVAFEWAQVNAYVAAEAHPLNKNSPRLAKLKISLHPSLTLMLYQNKPWIIYRYQNRVHSEKINPVFFNFLQFIQKKHSLSSATQALSQTLNEKTIKKILPLVPNWFTIAQSRGWFVLYKDKKK
jgi:hypothetical protein